VLQQAQDELQGMQLPHFGFRGILFLPFFTRCLFNADMQTNARDARAL
jgi:hypothetical protein